jgi:hypothetical protein
MPSPADGGSSDSDEYKPGSMDADHSPVESGDGRLSGDSPVAMKTVRRPTWTAWFPGGEELVEFVFVVLLELRS